MEETYHRLISELNGHNIRLSYHRLKVLEYLCRHADHPTVEQIYDSVQKEIPTLSKTTVYNTLHVLENAGLVSAINMEDKETRYDIVTKNHGHFLCEKCGEIFDFKVNPDALAVEGLTGFKVTDRRVCFKGVCPKCLSNTADHV